MRDVCVFTAIMGNYERLVDPAPGLDTDVKFVCFTDNADLTSDRWEIRHVRPTFPMDPIRSQRAIKICPHHFMSDFTRSIYVDTGIIFRVPPEQLLELYGHCELALVSHSFRASLIDEFIEVSRLGLDDQSRIFEQLNHYEISDPDLLEQKPYWGAILVRDHSNRRVREFSDWWLTHVLRYSRRDQLSLNWALKHSGIEPTVIDVDNHISWFHEWKPGERERKHWLRDPQASFRTARQREREEALFAPTASSASREPAGIQPSLAVGNVLQEHAQLGHLEFLGCDQRGNATPFARDHAVAKEHASRREAGERWFSIADGGQMKPMLVLSRLNRDHETSVFLRWRHNGEERVSRILLEPDNEGYARLKVCLDP